jgi:hypothetical protein
VHAGILGLSSRCWLCEPKSLSVQHKYPYHLCHHIPSTLTIYVTTPQGCSTSALTIYVTTPQVPLPSMSPHAKYPYHLCRHIPSTLTIYVTTPQVPLPSMSPHPKGIVIKINGDRCTNLSPILKLLNHYL